jgi:hypothetical protein
MYNPHGMDRHEAHGRGYPVEAAVLDDVVQAFWGVA